MSSFLRCLSILLILAVAVLQHAQGAVPTVENVCAAKNFRWEIGSALVDWPYRLHVPRDASANQKYPLIVWLHGEGESGDDNRKQMRHLDTTLLIPDRRTACQFFILLPQKPTGVSWSGQPAVRLKASRHQPDMLDVVTELLDEVLTLHPIDQSRIIVTGLSSGGAAAWELGTRRPNRFAAVLPFSAAPTSNTDLDQLLTLPVWAFYSPTDYVAPPDATQRAVRQLQEKGARAAFTFSNDAPDSNVTHYCWASAFRDYDLYDWLLAQGRGRTEAPLPGQTTSLWQFKWSQLVPALSRGLPIVVGGLLISLCIWDYRRRKAARAARTLPGDLE